MRINTERFVATGADPAIELANIDLLRQDGEVSPIILDIMAGVYSVRKFITRLRQPEI